MFRIVSICKGGGYRYCRTDPPHPKQNSSGLYPLHRVLMENKIGRLLGDDEIVHHRDENKQNDSPDNLEIKTNSEHSRDHMIVDEIELVCRCGVSFSLKPHQARLREKRSKTSSVYCSRSCGARFSQASPMT